MRLYPALYAVHSVLHNGDIWYINPVAADGGDGQSPSSQFNTIAAAIDAAADGDILKTAAGDYDEDSLDLNKILWLDCELGTVLSNTAGGATELLTISSAFCQITQLSGNQAGVQGVVVTGAVCLINTSEMVGTTTGFVLQGDRPYFDRVRSTQHTVTGFDVQSAYGTYEDIYAAGNGGATRGIYLSTAGADDNTFDHSITMGNATRGWEAVAGANTNVFVHCSSGGGDGTRVDAGTNNFWPGWNDEFEFSHHEHLTPMCDGEGGAITVPSIDSDAEDETNGAASTQYYWGEPTALIARDTVTADYKLLGLEIVSFTAGKSFQWAVYATTYEYMATKNGGNAWDEGETQLTVDDATPVSDNDLVLIYSDYKIEIVRVNGAPAGNVITIERETSQFGAANTGLRWNHTTNDPGTEELFVIDRTAWPELHPIEGHVTWAGPYRVTEPRHVKANGAVLMRMINLTDSTNNTAVTCFPITED